MESKYKRGKLLVDMSTGKITIQKPSEFTSDPFISTATDPTRLSHQDQTKLRYGEIDYQFANYIDAITEPQQKVTENTHDKLDIIYPKQQLESGEIYLKSRSRSNSVSSDATVCADELFNEQNISSESQSILTNNVYPSKTDSCSNQKEESHHAQSCEVHGCDKEVFSSCHKCQILLCWTHFINDDTSCTNHQQAPLVNNDLVSNGTNFILDEQTGMMIEQTQKDSESSKLVSNLILDEQTGQFIEQQVAQDQTNMLEEERDNDTDIFQGSSRSFNKAQRVLGKPYLKRKLDKTQVTLIPRPQKIIKEKPCTHNSTYMKSSRTCLCGMISDDQRRCIFRYYWDLGTWDAKKAYLKNLVRIRPIIRRRKNCDSTKKTIGYDCYLPTKNNEFVKVCKNFLLSTLDMNNETLSDWIKTLNKKPLQQEVSTEKSASQVNKVSEKCASVKEWLALLPKVPSHYCRSSTNRTYVEDTFRSKAHMFQTYKDWCAKESKPLARRKLFCSTLKSEKISIYKPRKDQCDTCTAFKENNVTLEEYQVHQEMKEEAYAAKKEALSLCSSEVLVFTVDTQSVLLCPKLLVSEQYYKQKLQIHNYTIYCSNNKDVDLFVWHEGHGDVTANEFTSCILNYLEIKTEGYKRVLMFSDGCGYQNRNKVLASALNDFAKHKGVEIEQRFLEKGHTMMEADSVHSTLERLFNPPIFLPSDYLNLMAQARPKQPYSIHHLDYTFFKNYSKICKLDSIRPGKKAGDPVVTNIRALLYKNGEIFYKLRHPEDWAKLPQRLQCNKSKLLSLYSAERKIENSKYECLQALKKYIHKDNHHFYDNLRH